MSFSYRGETKELDELTRKEINGSFIQLSHGVTHYELSNPEMDETVVLVHGFSVPYFIFDPTFEFLTRAGFRVLRYDLFGRGYSDRPHTGYNIDLFVRQLGDLLDALHIDQPVSLVGLSMGGTISAAFTVRNPQRVSKLVLIGPAGTKALFQARLQRIAILPGIGEVILYFFGNAGMIRRVGSDLFDGAYVEEFLSQYLPQLQYTGFRHAILSTLRSRVLDSFLDDYRRIGKISKPVLLFWGRQDHTVPFEHSDTLMQAIPQAEFHVIENSGHIPHYEKPEEVNPILLQFLNG